MRSGAGDRQRERTNNVFVCPHSGTRDRLGWLQWSWALKGSDGGPAGGKSAKEKTAPPLFSTDAEDRKLKQEIRLSREKRRLTFANMLASVMLIATSSCNTKMNGC